MGVIWKVSVSFTFLFLKSIEFDIFREKFSDSTRDSDDYKDDDGNDEDNDDDDDEEYDDRHYQEEEEEENYEENLKRQLQAKLTECGRNGGKELVSSVGKLEEKTKRWDRLGGSVKDWL